MGATQDWARFHRANSGERRAHRPFNPHRQRSSQTSNGNASEERDDRCILVTNLHRKTLAATIRDVFARFGEVERVELNLDDNEAPDGSAMVLFSSPPFSVEFLRGGVPIDGRTVRAELTAESISREHMWRGGGTRKSRRNRFQAKSFSMGVMFSPKTFVEEWVTMDEVAFVTNYDMRQIQIFFSHLGESYRLEFKFKDMLSNLGMEWDEATATTHFTIPLRYPARFWRQNRKAIRETKTSISVGQQWERVVDIPFEAQDEQRQELKRGPITLIAPEGKLILGTWIVYRVRFEPPPRLQNAFNKMLEEMAEYNLVPRDRHQQRPALTVIQPTDLPKPRTHVDRANMSLSFDVLYQLECVILMNLISEYNMDDDFYDTLSKLDSSVACGILELIAIQRERIWNPTQAFHDIWGKKGMRVQCQRRVPNHCALIRKIIITPTSIIIQLPTMETTNRVVRSFAKHAERFVRVQFVDDGLTRISAFRDGLGYDAVYNRIYKVMHSGIQIGSRRYDFLAFSSSQLRDHGCWFVAPSNDFTANKIRDWMGTFSHVKIVAKHAVRMGQCFSSTRPITYLNKDEVVRIDDVERNGYTFSDGVGNISFALAREVAQIMEIKSVPSAFQFRLGGAKGVLTVSSRLSGRRVEMRPSQIKFESEHYMLEVIRVSTHIPAYLNRQAITLLSTLGVKDEVFMNLMDAMIGSMSNMLANPKEAMRVLLGNMDEFGTVLSMTRLIGAGFLERNDPYIINLLNMFRVSILKDLKKKAKIHVPKGAFLLGVMDETNTLQENEVFCQVSNSDTSSNGPKHIVTGDCVVFRNPCFHPGDVRSVKAVDCPHLHHLTDVLVFSMQGFRDVPSMLSGGDLDGDDYTLFWDSNLMPPTPNYPPMDYTADEPLQVDDVKISHIHKFFVNYINNDNLGQIANAHLATADRSSKGALDGACLRLAQLHSLAVDFPKTGKPATLEEDLRVRIFPDFMQKKDKDMYESQKVLGRIYRAIDKADYKEYKSKLLDNTIYDARLRVDGMERYITEARLHKANYNRDLLSLMNQYGVQTEAEIISGYIVKWLNKGNRKSTHEIQKQTMKAVSNMRKTFRRQFEEEFQGESKGKILEISPDKRPEVEAKAAAWYYVTYHPDERQRTMTLEGNFLSFAWVVYDYICDIAVRNNSRTITPEQSLPVDDALVKELHLKYATEIVSIQEIVTDDEDEDEDEYEDEVEDEEDEDEYGGAGQVNGRNEAEPVAAITLSDLRRRQDMASSATAPPPPTSAAKQPASQSPSDLSPSPALIQNKNFICLDVDASEEDIAKALLGTSF